MHALLLQQEKEGENIPIVEGSTQEFGCQHAGAESEVVCGDADGLSGFLGKRRMLDYHQCSQKFC